MSNAIKFSQEGQVVRIRVSKIGDGKGQISVRDQGIGIPQEHLPLMFSLDRRKNRRGTHNESTSGFGLFVVNQVVSMLDGTVSVESDPSNGTVFRVVLPLDCSDNPG